MAKEEVNNVDNVDNYHSKSNKYDFSDKHYDRKHRSKHSHRSRERRSSRRSSRDRKHRSRSKSYDRHERKRHKHSKHHKSRKKHTRHRSHSRERTSSTKEHEGNSGIYKPVGLYNEVTVAKVDKPSPVADIPVKSKMVDVAKVRENVAKALREARLKMASMVKPIDVHSVPHAVEKVEVVQSVHSAEKVEVVQSVNLAESVPNIQHVTNIENVTAIENETAPETKQGSEPGRVADEANEKNLMKRIDKSVGVGKIEEELDSDHMLQESQTVNDIKEYRIVDSGQVEEEKVGLTVDAKDSSKTEIGNNMDNQGECMVDDDFDMFNEEDTSRVVDAVVAPVQLAKQTMNGSNLQSNCDDAEGYYLCQLGEVVHEKYRVVGKAGKGVFSTVLHCKKIGTSESVALKLVRNNDTMRKAAVLEHKILQELSENKNGKKRHIVSLLDSFEHRHHSVLVFESMSMNLREAMKKFGGKGGISIQAVKIFTRQLLIALKHMHSCEIVHADIKPDNILLDATQTQVKICDFGSAFKMNTPDSQQPTPYLVSRFYRSPEIILGLPYDYSVDMWSIGCCVYEMFTGKVLFPGASNNEMLKLFMQLQGRLSTKLIKRHKSIYIQKFEMQPHFDNENRFISREIDIVTGKPINRLFDFAKPKVNLDQLLDITKAAKDQKKTIAHMKSFLDKVLNLDPTKRLSIKDAFHHPFVKT